MEKCGASGRSANSRGLHLLQFTTGSRHSAFQLRSDLESECPPGIQMPYANGCGGVRLHMEATRMASKTKTASANLGGNREADRKDAWDDDTFFLDDDSNVTLSLEQATTREKQAALDLYNVEVI